MDMRNPERDAGRPASNADLIRSSLDALDQGITIFDTDLNLVLANHRFLELRDLPPHLGKVGARFEDQVRFRAERGDYGPGDVDALVNQHVEKARKFQPHHIERTHLDGKVLEIRGDPLPGGGFIATYTDITSRKLAEEALRQGELELQKQNSELESARAAAVENARRYELNAQDLQIARQELEATSRAKSEFLANMSHELRTPLNAIMGFSEIIKGELLGEISELRYTEYARDIYDSGKHLLDLINDILDLSKVESGRDELHEEEIPVPALLKSSFTLVNQRALKHGIELIMDCSDDVPMLFADNRKMKQIMVNLLTNAIKFTEPGGKVTVKAWCSLDSGYVFQVIDTGIGMSLEDIPKALALFGQVDSDLNRKHEGTGLGLPLTKSLVELHSGSMDVQSEVDVGTTITMRFPAERVRAAN